MMAEDYGMPTKSSILLYQTEDGRQRIEVRLENETVWLSQRLLAGAIPERCAYDK